MSFVGNTPTPLAQVFGNLAFVNSGNRITGDFSSGTVANRVMFQTSTTNGNTLVSAIPNGTGVSSQLFLYSSSDATNSSYLQIAAGANGGTENRVVAHATGTGTQLPMTFYTGGAERMRIDTSGNLGVGGTPSFPVHLQNAAARVKVESTTGTNTAWIAALNTGGNFYFGRDNSAGTAFGGTAYAAAIYADGTYPITFVMNGAEKARIDASTGLNITSPTGLGYGTGAGGTVTQSTSKSTAVTLNKPTGLITMNNAALGANTSVAFTLNNSLITATDVVIVNIQNSISGATNYFAQCCGVFSGSAVIVLRNMSAVSQSDAVNINFCVLKGATS